MDTVRVTLPRTELESLLASRSRMISAATRDQLRAQLQILDEARLEMHLGWMEEADQALPLLQAALALGTYVRTNNVWHGRSDSRYIVTPHHSAVSGVACKVLEARGYDTQMVGVTDRGWKLCGVRLRPNGDERDMVDESEVYLDAGRCAKCGYSREEARRRTCLGVLGSHQFTSIEMAA